MESCIVVGITGVDIGLSIKKDLELRNVYVNIS